MIKKFKIFESNDDVEQLHFNYQGYRHTVYQYKGINFEKQRNGSFFLQPFDCDGNLDREKTLEIWRIKFNRLTASNAPEDAKFLGYSIEKTKLVVDKLLMEIETNKYNL